MQSRIKKLTIDTELRLKTLPTEIVVEGVKVRKFWRKTFFDLHIVFVYESGNRISETYTFHKYKKSVRVVARPHTSLYVVSKNEGDESLTIDEFKSRAAKKFGFHSTKFKKFLIEAEYTLLSEKTEKAAK